MTILKVFINLGISVSLLIISIMLIVGSIILGNNNKFDEKSFFSFLNFIIIKLNFAAIIMMIIGIILFIISIGLILYEIRTRNKNRNYLM